ncbi:hypothetical protein GGR50DRAFT_263162 [Xylaria sp. CBS 124048]|nr:hypothetical protein GGR50DRAFT_263162 [Xylaria sp. CBS 124048]
MVRSTIVAVLLGASTTFAAPTWPHPNWNFTASNTDGRSAVSEYFNLLAEKINAAKHTTVAPVCDLSKAQIPTGATPSLPAPQEGLVLEHVAIGRGVQNYTCDPSKPDAAPTQIGALATLFNASCIASAYPDLLQAFPKLALQFDLPLPATSEDEMMGPTNLLVSGKHFFTNTTTPFFDLNTSRRHLGEAPCAKLDSSNAPSDAPKGPNGEAAVPWLRLGAESDATGGLKEIYRVETAGGGAPATCQGMPAAFEVQYAAQYWFFRSP